MAETARDIPRRDCDMSQAVTMAQMHMLDLADRKFGFTRKVLSLETGIPSTTLKSYEEGTAMPLTAFVRIAAVKGFPNELLALVLDLSGKAIADAEAEETDIDDAARAAVEFLARYVGARHPDSSSGIKIDHTEKPDLKLAAAGMSDRAMKVVS